MSVTFTAAAEKLGRAEYDVFETDNHAFAQDAAEFKAVLQELDKRLAALILQVMPRTSSLIETFHQRELTRNP